MLIPWHHLAELGAFESASFALYGVLDLHVARLARVVSDTRRPHRLILAPVLMLLRLQQVDATLLLGRVALQASSRLLVADHRSVGMLLKSCCQ